MGLDPGGMSRTEGRTRWDRLEKVIRIHMCLIRVDCPQFVYVVQSLSILLLLLHVCSVHN